MPIGFHKIDDLHNSVERPVLQEIFRDLLERFNFPKEIGISEKGKTGHSILSGTNFDKRSEVKWDKENTKLSIKSTEEVEAKDVLFTQYHAENNVTPFFKDHKTGVKVQGIYERTKVTVSCTYLAKNRQDAEYFRNQFRKAAALDNQHQLLEARLFYLLPKQLMIFLAHCYSLMEKQYGYGITFQQWLMDSFDERYKIASDSVGNNNRWAISEKRLRIVGYFDVEHDIGLSEVKEDGDVRYEVSFNYIYHYDKPVEVKVTYPIAIHQTPIDSKYQPDYPELDALLRSDLTQMPIGAFLPFEFSLVGSRNLSPYMVPENDLWTPRNVMPNYVPFLSLMVILNGDGNMIGNIGQTIQTNYSSIEIYDEVLEYITKNRTEVLYPWAAPYYVALYEGDYPLNHEFLHIDEFLNVSFVKELNPRKLYRLVFFYLDQIEYVNEQLKEKIRSDPPTFKLIVEANTGKEPVFDITPSGKVDKIQFEEIIHEVATKRPLNRKLMRFMKTAGIFTLRTLRQ